MKKNRMMRLASILLVCVLLTTSVISGTFAKYITTDAQYDTARVAKFGVVASLTGDLFGATYAAAGDNTIMTYGVNDGTVSSSDKALVVAPGTENKEGLTIAITGTPEVKTRVIFDNAENAGTDYSISDIYLKTGEYGTMVLYTGEVTAENIENYYVKDGTTYRQAMASQYGSVTNVYELHDVAKFDGENYYPLTWKVEANGATTEYKNVAAVQKALSTQFNKEFKPNESNAMNAVVTWAWAYGAKWDDVAGTDEKTVENDRKDTILGNMMADKDDTTFEVVRKNGNTFYVVEYAEKTVGATTTVIAKANTAEVACLTVAFNARLTVEQVD